MHISQTYSYHKNFLFIDNVSYFNVIVNLKKTSFQLRKLITFVDKQHSTSSGSLFLQKKNFFSFFFLKKKIRLF